MAQTIRSLSMKSSRAPKSSSRKGVLWGGSFWFVPKSSVLKSQDVEFIPLSTSTSKASYRASAPFNSVLM